MLLEQLTDNEIKLSDVIDMDFLQEFQDNFAQAMGVGSIIIDNKGPVTKPSNFSDFCEKYIRNHPEGCRRCNECDIQAGKEAFATGKPIIYNCHAGLVDFSAPIIVDGKQIGSMLGGQVLTSPPDINKFKEITKLLGEQEENEMLEALSKIKVIPEENIKAAAQMMYMVANSLSKIGYQNLKISRNSKKIRSIIDSIPDGIVAVDDFGVIILCNSTLEKMFGYERSEIIGNGMDFLISENQEDSTSLSEFINHSSDKKGIKKDGSEFWAEIKISDVSLDEDFDGFSKIISIRDITSRKNLEQTVNNSRNQFLAILENLPFMAWLKDTEGRVIAVNEQFAQNCHKDIEDILGKTDLELFPRKLAESYIKDDQNIIKSKKQKAIEEQITTPDGIKWFETFKVPVFGVTGEVIGTTGYAIDVTERRKFDKSKNEFVSIISQELRSQLNAIRGALTIISDRLGCSIDEEDGGCTIYSNTRELVDLANINNAKLINLINDIVDIEKIETRSADYIIQSYDLRTIVEQVLYSNTFEVDFVLKNFETEAVVKVDKAKMSKVLAHLFYKAADCSLTDKPAEVVLSRHNNYIRMAITGFGYSIPKSFQKTLFQKFSKTPLPNASNSDKTGLELSLCKATIESFDGTITFENLSEGGTTFNIELPEFK